MGAAVLLAGAVACWRAFGDVWGSGLRRSEAAPLRIEDDAELDVMAGDELTLSLAGRRVFLA